MDSYQQQFFARWGAVRNPHVRALAWVLDSPNLLAPSEAIAVLPPVDQAWLFQLERDPAPLLHTLGERTYTRLGLYAERLLEHALRAQGRLVAHNVQVRGERQQTLGEFDFLLEAGPEGLEHWEFATKFYLLKDAASLDGLVGPGLADTLGAKMRKIFAHQLLLGQTEAAAKVLPRPVLRARALVKGWLFYPGQEVLLPGVAPDHCRGFWCRQSELPPGQFRVLPRLQWLAPWQGEADTLAPIGELTRPVLVAQVVDGREVRRGFVVPEHWGQTPADAKA